MNDRKSETPRTDSVECIAYTVWRANGDWNNSGKYIPSEFVRILERELTAAYEQIAEMREIIQTIADNTDCEFASCGVACSGYISALQEKAK